MGHDIPLLLAGVFYMVAAVLLYKSVRQQSPGWRTIAAAFTVAGAMLHTGAQMHHWFGPGLPDVSLPNVLSLCALVMVLMLISSLVTRNSLFDAGLVVLPIAAMVLLLEWAIPSESLALSNNSAGTVVHILSSVMAFGILSIAGVYALFVAIIDYFLRHHHLNPLVRTLPALDILESLLFQLIAAGFLVLTISLISGLLFINDIFAQHLVHKTALSIATWLVFGLLLWGRWRYGWRGRLAVWLTLAGIALLLLSYFGTKLVLEVILGRSWQS
jgi:ABC-type uncharacterized transport system permease subunit